MNGIAVASLLATLTLGGAIGSGVAYVTLNQTVTCETTAVAPPPPPADLAMQKMMTPTRIPLTGYKQY